MGLAASRLPRRLYESHGLRFYVDGYSGSSSEIRQGVGYYFLRIPAEQETQPYLWRADGFVLG